MGGVTASSRISPNVNVGKECYVNPILARRVGRAHRSEQGGHRALRRVRPHARRGGVGQLLDRHGQVHEGRSRLAQGCLGRHREELADVVRLVGQRATWPLQVAEQQRERPPEEGRSLSPRALAALRVAAFVGGFVADLPRRSVRTRVPPRQGLESGLRRARRDRRRGRRHLRALLGDGSRRRAGCPRTSARACGPTSTSAPRS